MSEHLESFLVHVGTADARGVPITVEQEVKAKHYQDAFAHVARIVQKLGDGIARWHRIERVGTGTTAAARSVDPASVKCLTVMVDKVVDEGFVPVPVEAWAPVVETASFDWIVGKKGENHATATK